MEDFVTYEQAKKLREVGFKYPCNHYYSSDGGILYEEAENDQTNYIHCNTKYLISAPTLAQVQKWVREKHNLIVIVDTYFKNYLDNDFSKAEFEYIIVNMNNNATRKASHYDHKIYETYERALKSGIDKAIELLKYDNDE